MHGGVLDELRIRSDGTPDRLRCNPINRVCRLEDRMVTTFVILGLLAVVAAIGAAYRVQDKRLAGSLAPSRPAASASSVREAEALEAVKSVSQPDRDSTQTLTGHSGLNLVETSVIGAVPEGEALLATSLPVSEVVQPEADGVAHPVGMTEAETVHPASAAPQAAHTLLEEISQLGRSGGVEQIEQLAQHLHHPDTVVRVAIAFALGELAERQQGQNLAAIVPLLNELSQDADSQVKLQALAAMGRVQLADVSAHSDQ